METTSKSFPLRKIDLQLFRNLEPTLRQLLSLPDATAEEIVGIARAIRLIQRLPLCSNGIDILIEVDFRGNNVLSTTIVRLSSDELSGERSASSRLSEEYQFESFPSFDLTIRSDGYYAHDGNKREFFDGFVASLGEIARSTAYGLTISDDSTAVSLPPLDNDGGSDQSADEPISPST